MAAIKAQTAQHREAKEAAHAEIASHEEAHADMHADHAEVAQQIQVLKTAGGSGAAVPMPKSAPKGVSLPPKPSLPLFHL